MLLGRQDLVEAGQHAINPHGGIGRGMKVGKEEMIGALAAVERYLKVDHAAYMVHLYHARQHLWIVARAGRGGPEDL